MKKDLGFKSGVEPDAAHAGDIIPTHPWARGLAATSCAALLPVKLAWLGASAVPACPRGSEEISYMHSGTWARSAAASCCIGSAVALAVGRLAWIIGAQETFGALYLATADLGGDGGQS